MGLRFWSSLNTGPFIATRQVEVDRIRNTESNNGDNHIRSLPILGFSQSGFGIIGIGTFRAIRGFPFLDFNQSKFGTVPCSATYSIETSIKCPPLLVSLLPPTFYNLQVGWSDNTTRMPLVISIVIVLYYLRSREPLRWTSSLVLFSVSNSECYW